MVPMRLVRGTTDRLALVALCQGQTVLTPIGARPSSRQLVHRQLTLAREPFVHLSGTAQLKSGRLAAASCRVAALST